MVLPLFPLRTEQDEWRFNATPRREKLVAPSVGFADAPYVTWRINREWLSHISGMVDVLSSQDMWQGTQLDIDTAIRQIAGLLASDWLCDVGIESLFWDECGLTAVIEGVESLIVSAAEIQACLTIPTGGAATILGATYNLTIAQINFTNTSYSALAATSQNHVFTRPKALIGCYATVLNSGAAANVYMKPVVINGGIRYEGVNLTEFRGVGTNGRDAWAWDYFEDLDLTGTNNIYCDVKVSSATGSLTAGSDIQYVVLEYDTLEDLSDLFVQDIRITAGGELQKQIAGVWITVDVSLASLLADIQAAADAAAADAADAAAAAAAAQADADAAITMNSVQNTRLDALEAADIAIDTRLDALEASAEIWDWVHEIDFTISNGGWSVPLSGSGTYVAAQGWRSATSGSFSNCDILLAGVDPAQNQIFYVQMDVSLLLAPTGIETIVWRYGENPGNERAKIAGFPIAGDPDKAGYFRNLNEDNSTMLINASNIGGTQQFYIRSLKFYGMGESPF